MKTTKLLAMSMALCLGATSAFGQPTNDDCSGAIAITPGAGCTVGKNVDATFSTTSEPASCGALGTGDWASNENATVWYSFSLSHTGSLPFIISTDNGEGDFNTDTQLALYEGSCGSLTHVACSEDDGDFNGLAAEIRDSLLPGNYLIQVDVFGTTQAKFCINVYEDKAQANDIISGAIDISSDLTSLDSSNAIISTPYFYGTPNNLATESVVPDDATAVHCNSVDSVYYDVWFKFTYDKPNMEAAWLNIYPNNGDNFYGIQLFEKPIVSNDAITVNGTYIDCSLFDGSIVHGDSRDLAKGNFTDHPRIDLTLLNNTSEYYLRVYQYTRVNVGATNPIAPPSDGIFNMVIEHASSGGKGIDGLSTDNACNALSLTDIGCTSGIAGNDVSHSIFGLCNAGMTGGLTAAQGSTFRNGPIAGEPGQFDVAAGSTRAEFNCDNSPVITGAKSLFNNNSAYYKFTVADDIRNILIPDTLIGVTINDSIIFVPDLSGGDDSIPVPSEEVSLVISICTGITAGGLPLPDPINVPFGFCDEIMALCGADVKFCFNNMEFNGVNGSTGEFYVIPTDVDCSDDVTAGIAAFGELPDSACDTCLCMGPSSFYLPGNEYLLVVDGDGGSLVQFDLDVNIVYSIPGTTIPCGTPCGSAAPGGSTKSLSANTSASEVGIKMQYLAPMPAKTYVNAGFISGTEGNAKYVVNDINGKIVDHGAFAVTEGENVHRFDTEQFEAGIYILTMQINGIATQMRIVKAG